MGHPLARILKSFAALRHSTLVFILFAFAVPLAAQTTSVTGTVKDTNGLPYAGASVKAQLVLAGSAVNGQPTVTVTGVQACRSSGFGSSPCQVPFQGTVGPITLDTTGSFILSLQDNALVTPAGTQWLFSATISPGIPPPLGTGPQACSATLTITGASQSVSSSLQSCPRLSNSAGAIPNTPTPPALAQGPTFNVVNYGAKGDAQHIADGITAGAAKTVTSATAAWCGGSISCPAGRTSDIGKFISCTSTSGILMPATAKIVSVTATVATTDTNDSGAAGSLTCIWYTKDDTAAFTSAFTAANPATVQTDPNVGTTLGTPPGTVYCPEGQYAVSAPLFTFVGAGSSIGPNFVGAGRNKCIIYPIPGSSLTYLFYFYNGIGAKFSDFTIDGLRRSYGTDLGALIVEASQQFDVSNVEITNYSNTSTTFGTFNLKDSSNGHIRNVFVQGGGTANDYACSFRGSSTVIIDNLTCSNHNQNLNIIGAGLRSVAGDNGPIFHGGIMDECGNALPNCTSINTNGGANFYGTSFMGGFSGSVSIAIDGTSRAYFSNISCGVFGNSTVTMNCMSIASGGEADVTMSDLRGNDSNSTTGAAVTGPVGAKFFDLGGNKIRHSVSGVIADVTPAQYSTLGFTGGIVPKATVTHTPNTCYAITGNLLATAQNLCTFTNDQNYQIVNVTAQSGGTTPAASACATPPVITFSDGTRTTTLTMTTAKTTWSSAVDTYTGANQVFAGGTTLTISIGANTCATPPANVSVSYVLQSVLNP